MNDLRDCSPNQDPLEDEFIHALIDCVQKNPCVFNRYDPLHKVTEYKHEIWKVIAKEIGYDGEPIELERKWKHMRDKYVRLRKQDKHKAPIKKTNKWYNYYHKMSFLDPYVEHRNRKRQKEMIDGEDLLEDDIDFLHLMKQENRSISPNSSSTSSGHQNQNTESPTMSVENLAEDTKKHMLFQFLMENGLDKTANATTSKIVDEWCVSPPEPRSSRKRKQVPKQIIQDPSPPPSEKMAKWERPVVEDPLKGLEDTHVTYFCRSVSKSLLQMDPKKFALARLEISKVLYNLECP